MQRPAIPDLPDGYVDVVIPIKEPFRQQILDMGDTLSDLGCVVSDKVPPNLLHIYINTEDFEIDRKGHVNMQNFLEKSLKEVIDKLPKNSIQALKLQVNSMYKFMGGKRRQFIQAIDNDALDKPITLVEAHGRRDLEISDGDGGILADILVPGITYTPCITEGEQEVFHKFQTQRGSEFNLRVKKYCDGIHHTIDTETELTDENDIRNSQKLHDACEAIFTSRALVFSALQTINKPPRTSEPRGVE